MNQIDKRDQHRPGSRPYTLDGLLDRPHASPLTSPQPCAPRFPKQNTYPTPARQEPDEFDKLYRDHVDLIYRYAYRLCGETESAKDLVQETFLNAYRGLKIFGARPRSRPGCTPSPHGPVYGCGASAKGNRSTSCRSKNSCPLPRENFTSRSRWTGSARRGTAEQGAAESPRPGDRQTAPKYRMALVLRDMEGLSAKEVGAVMGLNERAVNRDCTGHVCLYGES